MTVCNFSNLWVVNYFLKNVEFKKIWKRLVSGLLKSDELVLVVDDKSSLFLLQHSCEEDATARTKRFSICMLFFFQILLPGIACASGF